MKQYLSNSLINQLMKKQITGRASVSDTKVKGLAVDLRKSGATFYLRLTVNQRTRRHTLGHFGAIDVRMARHMALEKRRQFTLETHEVGLGKPIEMNFDEYFENHFLPWCKVYRKTYSSHRSLYKNHLKKRFGHMPLGDVSNKYILGLVQGLADEGYRKSFINKSIQHLRSALKKADELCEVETHPSLQKPFTLPQAPTRKERFLTKREACRLTDYIDANNDDPITLLLGFLLYTGARRHEAMNAEWQHINFDTRSWYVPLTKSGKPRYIVLNDRAMGIIKSARSLQREKFGGQHQWLFVNPQSNRPYQCIFYRWQNIRSQLGLQDMRIHDLRHSFASTLVNNGATLYEVQKLLGHERSATTERYAHLADHTLHRAAQLIDKAYR